MNQQPDLLLALPDGFDHIVNFDELKKPLKKWQFCGKNAYKLRFSLSGVDRKLQHVLKQISSKGQVNLIKNLKQDL